MTFQNIRLLGWALISLLLGIAAFGANSHADEDWKGKADTSELSFGALTGLGILQGVEGFTFVGTLSKKILHNGFVPDINDSVSIELELGPVFQNGPSWFYSTHLRWDFVKDSEWTFYALGGFGGNVVGGNPEIRSQVFPRYGVGAMWDKIKGPFLLRFELSHELIAVGLVVPLFY